MPLEVVQPPSKSLRRSKNDKKWDVHKDDIHRLYKEKNESLETTKQVIENLHGFKASVRKWKGKLEEWGFLKNLSADSMRFIVAKGEKRAREGKDTVFLFGGSKVTEKRIQNFKRRKTSDKDTTAAAPLSAGTPAGLSYFTPRTEMATPSADDLDEKAVEDIEIRVSNDDVTSRSSLEPSPRPVSAIIEEPENQPALEAIAANISIDKPVLVNYNNSAFTPSNSLGTLLGSVTNSHAPLPPNQESGTVIQFERLNNSMTETLLASIHNTSPLDEDEMSSVVLEISSSNLRLTSSYGLLKASKFAEARKECEAAIAGFEALGLNDVRLESQCLLGEILTNMDTCEAEICLIRALAESLERMHMHHLTLSVQSLLRIIPHTQSPEEVGPILTRILEIAKCYSQYDTKSHWCDSKLLSEAIALASTYPEKQRGGFDFASQVLAAVESQIDRLSSIYHFREKAEAYLKLVLYHQRKESPEICAYYLERILKTISESGRSDNLQGKNLEMCVKNLNVHSKGSYKIFEEHAFLFRHALGQFDPDVSSSKDRNIDPVERNKDKVGDEPGRGVPTIREGLLLSKWYTDMDDPWASFADISCQYLPTISQAKGAHKRTHGLPSSISGQSSSFRSSRSYKYGLTYSEPSIAGISDSVSRCL